MRTLFTCLTTTKTCTNFRTKYIVLVLKYFSLKIDSLKYFFVNNAANFIPDFSVFFINCLSLIKKDMNVVSLKVFKYPFIFGGVINKLFIKLKFIKFFHNFILKPILSMSVNYQFLSMLDINILTICTLLKSVGLRQGGNFQFSILISLNFKICLFIFL